jgi:dGTPase
MSASPAGTPPAGYDQDDIDREHRPSDPDDDRERFCRDYDRLVHSPAFRRLQGKTQVVSPGEADFFRTRLTHTVEVAQVARRLATKLDTNRDLCEAAAVLHDLGHPPFAHIGEKILGEAIDEWATTWGLEPVVDVGGFNGNAQSFRLAVKSLSHSPGFRGLDLTRGVLDGAVKYPYERAAPGIDGSADHWCFYPTERKEADWVRLGVPPERATKQSLEAQIVDWADDVAYAIHDVEDWYRAGFMPLEMLATSKDARQGLAERIKGSLANKDLSETDAAQETEAFFAGDVFRGITRSYDGSREAKAGLKAMRSALFDDFTDVALEHGAAVGTRHHNDLKIEPIVRLHNKILKRLLWVYVIAHARMATHQMGQARVIRELFDIHIGALNFDPAKGAYGEKAEHDIFPPDIREELQVSVDKPTELLRLVTDHIAGMTDSYAMRLHARLTGAEPGLFNAFM